MKKKLWYTKRLWRTKLCDNKQFIKKIAWPHFICDEICFLSWREKNTDTKKLTDDKNVVMKKKLVITGTLWWKKLVMKTM